MTVSFQILLLLSLITPITGGSSPRDGDVPTKSVDRLLQAEMATGRAGAVRVIVRAQPDRLDEVVLGVQLLGGTVLLEHRIINAVTARIEVRQLQALLAQTAVAGLSSDGSVRSSQYSRYPTRTTTKTPTTTTTATKAPTTTTTTPTTTTAAAKTPTTTPTTSSADTVTLSSFQTLTNVLTSMWSYSDLLPKTLLYQTLGISDISYLGDGVGVAIIDSGLLSDIGGVAAFYDFTQGTGAVAARAFDDYGHGSHVAGQITDPGLMSAGAYGGLAPKARLIGLKVLDKDGVGRTSDVISAIEFALAKRSSLGIDVINLSLGHPVWEPAATDPLVLAVERAVAAPALANLLCRAAAPDEREHHVGRFHRAAALAGPSSVRRRG